MSNACTSLKSLEYDAAATVSTDARSTEIARQQLLTQLVRVAADANTLVATVRKPLPDTPQGASIAMALYRGGTAFRSQVTSGQALVRGVAVSQLHTKAAALTTQLRKQSIALGMTFIHLGSRYPSAQLNATIVQTPACGLVHG